MTERCAVWITREQPGYLGKKKDSEVQRWNEEYGTWRYAWELKTGEVITYDRAFYEIFVAGYAKYFYENPDDAKFLTNFHSYAYDKNVVTKEQAFDPYYLYDKPGYVNQIHHAALNIALERFLGMEFKGSEPIQVRLGGKDKALPAGWRWNPGSIPAANPDLIEIKVAPLWWSREITSIESQYQQKVVQELHRSF